MSRELQFIGLPKEANLFLHNDDVLTTCPTCKHDYWTGKYTMKVYEEQDMFHGSMIDLHDYYLNDVLIYREVVQADPWSSGPVVFLKLVDADGKDVFTWTMEQIDSYL